MANSRPEEQEREQSMQKIIRQIAAEIKVQEHQVKAAIELLDGGATVPFVARYRKEVTGGLELQPLRCRAPARR